MEIYNNDVNVDASKQDSRMNDSTLNIHDSGYQMKSSSPRDRARTSNMPTRLCNINQYYSQESLPRQIHLKVEQAPMADPKEATL